LVGPEHQSAVKEKAKKNRKTAAWGKNLEKFKKGRGGEGGNLERNPKSTGTFVPSKKKKNGEMSKKRGKKSKKKGRRKFVTGRGKRMRTRFWSQTES